MNSAKPDQGNRFRDEEDLHVVHEDNHVLVVYKPPGLLSQGDATGDASVLDLARAYLKRRYDKPGNVYVATVHRLDRPVGGLLVLARTSKAASRLTQQFRDRTVRKVYRAAVEGVPEQAEGILRHRLSKDRETRTVSVVEDDEAGKDAELAFRRLESQEGLSLLEVELHTGRGHQIRVQLAETGYAIVGDTKYGSRYRLADRSIALQAWSLAFEHPTRPERLSFTLPARFAWDLTQIRRRALR